jgi:hypothetical protein
LPAASLSTLRSDLFGHRASPVDLRGSKSCISDVPFPRARLVRVLLRTHCTVNTVHTGPMAWLLASPRSTTCRTVDEEPCTQ